jgi:predicted esterase
MAATADPHAGQPVLRSGPRPEDARLVAILLHGRGASAEDILGLANQFSARDIAYVAPQAAGSTWYPYSFLAPIAQNEPWLGSALRIVAGLVEDFTARGIPADRLAVMGFSQGACLTLEFAAVRGRRGVYRRPDRATGHHAKLHRRIFRHAGVHRVQ